MSIPIIITQVQLLNLHKEQRVMALIKAIIKDKTCLMWPTEMIQVYNCASITNNLSGDFAEVGISKGGSAKLICEVKNHKQFHLFDTFVGLPEPGPFDDRALCTNQYSVNLNLVKKYLDGYENVTFHAGLFPKTAIPTKHKTFAFVHIDADIYRSTIEALKFFYPRMVKRGIILSHDYTTLIGVKKAFDEFFSDKEEPVIELSTSQCMVIKN